MTQYFSFTGPKFLLSQYFILFLAIAGAFFVEWTLFSVLILFLFFYIYGCIGMSMMLHRYFSHRSFKFKNANIEKLFTFISIIAARGSPLAWAHIHRTHHKYSDTDKDPHRPTRFLLFSFRQTYISEFNIFLVKDLMTPVHRIIHNYYFLFILIWVVLVFIISPTFLYFSWILPVCLNQISQDIWNYFSHVPGGYQNFKTGDNSQNVSCLWPLILGEAWHNNHHSSPSKINLGHRKYEYDPVYYLIRATAKC